MWRSVNSRKRTNSARPRSGRCAALEDRLCATPADRPSWVFSFSPLPSVARWSVRSKMVLRRHQLLGFEDADHVLQSWVCASSSPAGAATGQQIHQPVLRRDAGGASGGLHEHGHTGTAGVEQLAGVPDLAKRSDDFTEGRVRPPRPVSTPAARRSATNQQSLYHPGGISRRAVSRICEMAVAISRQSRMLASDRLSISLNSGYCAE